MPKRRAEPAPAKNRRGRKQEKKQISVRIDKAVMDLAYVSMKQDGERITDLLERGLVLALAEKTRIPVLTSQLRFIVQKLSIERQRRVKRMLALDVMAEVRELEPLERLFREFQLATIDQVESWPGYQEALEKLAEASQKAPAATRPTPRE